MNKKLLVFAGVLFILSLGATLFIWLRSPGASPNVPLTTQNEDEVLVTWDDPAGFTFEYPEGIEIDKHDEDMENYAHVELTHPDHPGSIIVWAKDVPLGVTTLEEWVEDDDELAGANVIDTTFGDKPGKKSMVASSQKVVIGTIYDELLWYVESELESSKFWSSAFETITSSFEFKPLADETDAGSSSSNTEVFSEPVDEEETLE